MSDGTMIACATMGCAELMALTACLLGHPWWLMLVAPAIVAGVVLLGIFAVAVLFVMLWISGGSH